MITREEQSQLLKFAVFFEGGMGIVALILGWLTGYYPVHYLHLRPADALWAVAATVPLLVLFALTTRFPLGFLKSIRRKLDDAILPLFGGLRNTDLLLLAILAGWGEELLFRGFLQPLAADYTGPIVAIIVTNILFGLAHLITPAYAIIAALVGAYLGWLMLRFDNLAVPIIIHALYDYCALLFFLRVVHRNSPVPMPRSAAKDNEPDNEGD
ncbi:MAG: CPBP family intramembrane metalloprotease [Leptospiraceae bacterium]|nr:CPBP family intramembrane metalloprotease [Leptospiraceae bacterium]MCB1316226.1 CPBP family intramembrane metalloprotease [Leptospiraceae bacterium]